VPEKIEARKVAPNDYPTGILGPSILQIPNYFERVLLAFVVGYPRLFGRKLFSDASAILLIREIDHSIKNFVL